MCDGPALVLFRFEELELLVCGLPHFDFSSLKSGAKVTYLCSPFMKRASLDLSSTILQDKYQIWFPDAESGNFR